MEERERWCDVDEVERILQGELKGRTDARGREGWRGREVGKERAFWSESSEGRMGREIQEIVCNLGCGDGDGDEGVGRRVERKGGRRVRIRVASLAAAPMLHLFYPLLYSTREEL